MANKSLSTDCKSYAHVLSHHSAAVKWRKHRVIRHFCQNINLLTVHKYSKAQLRNKHCLLPQRMCVRRLVSIDFSRNSPTYTRHDYFYHSVFGVDTTKFRKRLRWRWMAGESMSDANEHAQCEPWATHTKHCICHLRIYSTQSTRPNTVCILCFENPSFAPRALTHVISAFCLRFPSDISTNRFICFEMMYAHLVTTLSSSKQ